MTKPEVLREVLQGVLLIVGEYRGSHVEQAGYVDRKFGNVINYIRAIHLVECSWAGHVDRLTITERFREEINTVELARATFRYVRGRRYVFYIEWLKRERGQIFAGLGGWGIDEIEDETADAAPAGAAPPPNLV
jgi:hypothetical protein